MSELQQQPPEVCNRCGKRFSRFRGITFDEGRFILEIDGQDIRFTQHEFGILDALFQVYPRIATKAFILDSLYTLEADHPAEKIIDVWVCKIRRKLRGTRLSIETVWGTGYELQVTLLEGGNDVNTDIRGCSTEPAVQSTSERSTEQDHLWRPNRCRLRRSDCCPGTRHSHRRLDA